MINVIIVDDELPARKELASILQNIKNVNIVAECALGQEALAFLEDNFAQKMPTDFLAVLHPKNGHHCQRGHKKPTRQ